MIHYLFKKFNKYNVTISVRVMHIEVMTVYIIKKK